jgi:hypothetical protein
MLWVVIVMFLLSSFITTNIRHGSQVVNSFWKIIEIYFCMKFGNEIHFITNKKPGHRRAFNDTALANVAAFSTSRWIRYMFEN